MWHWQAMVNQNVARLFNNQEPIFNKPKTITYETTTQNGVAFGPRASDLFRSSVFEFRISSAAGCSLPPHLLALTLPHSTVFSQPVNVQFSTLSLAGTPAARTITLTPSAQTLLQTDGTNIITGPPLVLPATAAGVATNLWPGAYTVTIQGIPKSWPLLVTTNFGLGAITPIPAVWFTTNLAWPGTNFQTSMTITVYGLLGDDVPGMRGAPVILFDP